MSSITDESHISEDTHSYSNSGSGEYESTRINHKSILSCEEFDTELSDYLAKTRSQILQSTILNRRSLSKDAKTYQLDTFLTNLMIVFNMFEIPEHDNRYGTDKDVEALVNCFKPRGFKVLECYNFTSDQIFEVFDQLILEDFSDVGCLAVVFLTHGEYDGILLTTFGELHEDHIIKYLSVSKMPSLINKPKILIFQTCRAVYQGPYYTMETSKAAKVTGEVQMTSDTFSTNGDHKFDNPYSMDRETDYLRLHSTYPGMAAFRIKESGSWFIQSLCKCIRKSNPDDDVLTIMTSVIHDVSITKEYKKAKQVPIMTSTLTKKLCFNTERVKPDLEVSERSDDVDSSIARIDVAFPSRYLTSVIKNIIALSYNVWRWALSIRSPWRRV